MCRRSVRSCAWLCVGLAVLLGSCRRSELDPDAHRATRTTVETLRPAPGALALPVRTGSVRFAAIGDSGRGDQAQREVAAQMVAWRERFPFEFVLMLGDNIYGPHTPADYASKFEEPYRPLLEAGVKFYAAIGNHDDPGSIFYGPFNMGGQRYYTFRRTEQSLSGITGGGVRFFALDSRSLDRPQLDWLSRELESSGSAWKICFFHHPIYTAGRYRSGAQALRRHLEPILVQGDVDVVLAGHEHFYERTSPQHGITYFISGSAGSLRPDDIRPSPITAAGFDRDYQFMLIEVSGDELFFQSITRTGATVDAGVIVKQGS